MGQVWLQLGNWAVCQTHWPSPEVTALCRDLITKGMIHSGLSRGITSVHWHFWILIMTEKMRYCITVCYDTFITHYGVISSLSFA